MSRILSYLKDRASDYKAKRADERQRTEDLGSPWLKYPMEQAEMAGQAARNAAPQAGPPTADAQAKQNVAQTTAEGVLKQGSQGGMMSMDAMRKGFDPSNAESVRQMQRMLNQAGFTSADGSPLAEDGMFGRKTEAALRRMQGGYRPDHASVADLTENPNAEGNINTRGKQHLASREGRGDRIIPEETIVGSYAGTGGLRTTEPEYDINTKQREDAVGNIRGGAKSIDDAIESAAPWLAESSPYRGAKEGLKSFFNWAGDADY
tara:strand:+ start:9175 stop:9963 length:789 start_codon:yes stop_codon:yes gene_type:complete